MLVPGPTAIQNGWVFKPSGTPIPTKNVRDASIDLSVGCILKTENGEVIEKKDSMTIKPQQTAVIISEECFNLPDKVIAQALLKNRLSQKGIIAFNTGIVDDNYQKPISTMIINLSNNSILITEKTSFLRIIFHRLDEEQIDHMRAPNLQKSQAKENIDDYIKYRKEEIVNLPTDFFSASEIREKIKGDLQEFSLGKFFSYLGAAVGVIVITMSLINGFAIPTFRENLFERELNETAKKLEDLQIQLESIEKKIDNSDPQKKVNISEKSTDSGS